MYSRVVNQEELAKLMKNGWSWREYTTSSEDPEGTLYLLEDESGNQLYATFVTEEVTVTATPNDIRDGVTAVTEDGLVVGEKEIPAYHTTEGTRVIPAGSKIAITIKDRYAYTKLQAIVCAFNTSLASSVAAEKVAINDSVYPVGSTEILAVVSIDPSNESIDLGITNESEKPCIVRFFSYKEEV